MTDIQAAIGLAQLSRLDEFNGRRCTNAKFFNDRIRSVITPRSKADYDHVWHQYTIRLNGINERNIAIEKFKEAGIGFGIYYPEPAYYFDHVRQVVGELDLPVVERLSREAVSLPVHPQLSEEDRWTIVNTVNLL